MTRTDVLSVARTPIESVIEDHGAFPVLIAAFGALLRRRVRAKPPARADLSKLDDWLLKDLGLPARTVRGSFPNRSP